MMIRVLARLLIVLTGLQLGACALEPDRIGGCATSEAERPPYTRRADTGHSTAAVTSGLPRVTRYRVGVDTATVTPCSEVHLRKELGLSAARESASVWEIQDLFAGNGTFIARHSEDISDQVSASGHYERTIVLPVPATTPPGRYKVVSRLIIKQNGRELPLASAVAEFRVRAATSGSRVRPETRR